jgi:hypothetical protein
MNAVATVAAGCAPDGRFAPLRMDKTHPDEKVPVYPRTGQGQFGRSMKRLEERSG